MFWIIFVWTTAFRLFSHSPVHAVLLRTTEKYCRLENCTSSIWVCISCAGCAWQHRARDAVTQSDVLRKVCKYELHLWQQSDTSPLIGLRVRGAPDPEGWRCPCAPVRGLHPWEGIKMLPEWLLLKATIETDYSVAFGFFFLRMFLNCVLVSEARRCATAGRSPKCTAKNTQLPFISGFKFTLNLFLGAKKQRLVFLISFCIPLMH